MVNNYIIKSQSFLLLNFVTAVMIEADKFIFLTFIKPDNLSDIDLIKYLVIFSLQFYFHHKNVFNHGTNFPL